MDGLWAAAECAVAYRRGDTGVNADDAFVGALLEADFHAHVRSLVKGVLKG